MMREIKFRVWHKADKKMYEVYGFSQNKWFLRGKNFPMPLGAIELMQYTGLKDKNGKEIYEGDVVHIKQTGVVDKHILNNVSAPISYEHGAFTVVDKNSEINIEWPIVSGLYYKTEDEFEVIGNIYEHSHLLDK